VNVSSSNRNQFVTPPGKTFRDAHSKGRNSLMNGTTTVASYFIFLQDAGARSQAHFLLLFIYVAFFITANEIHVGAADSRQCQAGYTEGEASCGDLPPKFTHLIYCGQN
jgi:hypothetical protein